MWEYVANLDKDVSVIQIMCDKNPAKTATVFLGNPEIFGQPIQCHPWGGGGGGLNIFWNSPLLSNSTFLSHNVNVLSLHTCVV